jgi:hypothetical protein
MKNMTVAEKIESSRNWIWQRMFHGSAQHGRNCQSGSQCGSCLKKCTSRVCGGALPEMGVATRSSQGLALVNWLLAMNQLSPVQNRRCCKEPESHGFSFFFNF